MTVSIYALTHGVEGRGVTMTGRSYRNGMKRLFG